MNIPNRRPARPGFIKVSYGKSPRVISQWWREGSAFYDRRTKKCCQCSHQAMSRELACCLALSRALANQIVDRVTTSGLPIHGVSALFPDQDTPRDLAPEKSSRIHPGEQISPSHRAAWRTARQSGFASICALTIQGVGSFVAAGPIILALSGAALGNREGGLADALIGLGIPKPDASLYESKLKEGSILILVHAGDLENLTLAKTIFREAGAQSICETRCINGSDARSPEQRLDGHSTRPSVRGVNGDLTAMK